MSDDTRYNDDGVRGNYTSVNDMPQFADYIAEHGPYPTQEYVLIQKNWQGHYTIDGEQAHHWKEDGTLEYLVTWDFEMFEADGGVDGLIPMEPVAPVYVDFGGERYIVNRTNNEYGDHIIYSILLQFSDGSGSMHMTTLAVPADHPVLQTYRRHPMTV